MSVRSSSKEDRSIDLAVLLRRAGAVSVAVSPVPAAHGTHAAIAHYGSAAGELAACVSAVGLADRSELGEGVLWLLQSDHHALALVSRAGAGIAWREIERAGRPLGVCAVGGEAFARYALAERMR